MELSQETIHEPVLLKNKEKMKNLDYLHLYPRLACLTILPILRDDIKEVEAERPKLDIVEPSTYFPTTTIRCTEAIKSHSVPDRSSRRGLAAALSEANRNEATEHYDAAVNHFNFPDVYPDPDQLS